MSGRSTILISEGTADLECVTSLTCRKQKAKGGLCAKKKESELNHPHFVAVRLSDVELHLLDQSASALGISRSEYLRKVLTEKEIQNRIEIVTDMESLRKLVSEYGKIGSNLNQIARYFNSGGERSLAIESEIHQCIAELFQLRKQVLQMAGETNGSS